MKFSFTNGKISRAHCENCSKTIFITTNFNLFPSDKLGDNQLSTLEENPPISYMFSFTDQSYAEFQEVIVKKNLYPIFHKALFHMIDTPIKLMERDGKKESPFEGSFKIVEHGLFFKCRLFSDFNSRNRILTFTELVSLDVDEYLDEIIRIKKSKNSEIKIDNDASNKL